MLTTCATKNTVRIKKKKKKRNYTFEKKKKKTERDESGGEFGERECV